MFQSKPTYFHGSFFAPGLALFTKIRFARHPFAFSNSHKGEIQWMNLSAFSSFLAIKPCWNHLTSNLGLINVQCGSPFPRTRLTTNKKRANYPGLLEKQIKRSAVIVWLECGQISVHFSRASWSRIVQLRPNFRPRSRRVKTRRKRWTAPVTGLRRSQNDWIFRQC